MPGIIYLKQSHIIRKHLFIFCGFYRHNIQPRVKKTAFFIQFYGLGVYLRHYF